MKKTVLAGTIAALMAGTAMAQTAGGNAELLEKVERLEAEVDYLKENAKADRKDGAAKAVVLEGLSTTAAKFVWSGDFRYRHEDIQTEGNGVARERDRIRVRFGALIKVADNINAKIQFSTTNSGADNARSTNQTLGNGTATNAAWDRKPVGLDQAYVEWKPDMFTTVQLGKTPIPWATTVSYFWDKDLTPEGGAVKYVNGPWFASATYNWLGEQNQKSVDTTYQSNRSTDSKMASAQIGWKQLLTPTTTLTTAVSYFDLMSVRGQPIATNSAVDPTCTASSALNPAFTSDGGLGNSVGPGSWNGATNCVLLSDFNLIEAQAQLDFVAGAYPVSVFVDYVKNNGAVANPTTNTKLDTALAVGFTFNKASAAKSWEAGVVYQKTEKDSVFGGFHDSDFGGGVVDTDGYALKAAYVPVVGWTLNATYLLNKRFNDVKATNGTITTAKVDHDYKRLQLDLNYKF